MCLGKLINLLTVLQFKDVPSPFRFSSCNSGRSVPDFIDYDDLAETIILFLGFSSVLLLIVHCAMCFSSHVFLNCKL